MTGAERREIVRTYIASRASEGPVLILDEAAVRKFLQMETLIPAMERALRALSAGDVVGRIKVARRSAEELTLFKSVGVAVEILRALSWCTGMRW